MTDMPARSGSSDDSQVKADGNGLSQNVSQPSAPSGDKEAEPVVRVDPESVEAGEIKEPEVPPEVAGWVERKERGEDVHLAQPVKHGGQTLVESAKPDEVKVVLPLSEEAVNKGLHVKVVHSLRWLAEWCVRVVKKLPEKVLYREVK